MLLRRQKKQIQICGGESTTDLPPEDWNRYLASPVDRTGACGRISSHLPSALSSLQRRSSSRRRRRHCPLEVRPSGWRKLRGRAGNQHDVHNHTEKQLILFIPAPAPVLFFPVAPDSEISKRVSKHTFKRKRSHGQWLFWCTFQETKPVL